MADLKHRITRTALVPASDLVANPKNWRTHPKHQRDALVAVLDRVGEVAPVLVNQRTGLLVDGHLRVEIAAARGQVVQANYVDLSPEEEALIFATFDPLSAMAETDDDAFDAIMAELRASTDAALDDLLNGVHGDAGRAPYDEATEEVPPLSAAVVTKPGDLYLLGTHRLLCGDARNADDMARLMSPHALAECVWTDPPYGVDYVGKTDDALTIQGDTAGGLVALLRAAFALVRRHCAPNAHVYCAAPAGPRVATFFAAFAEAFRFHETLVWVKNAMVLGHSDYHYRHEPILYGYADGAGRAGRGDHAGSRWYGDDSQTSVIEVPKPPSSRDHPTMKPVALIEVCLRNSTQVADRVLDPFAGSGSTLMACETLGRICYAMEIDPRYCDVIVARWEAHTKQKAERL